MTQVDSHKQTIMDLKDRIQFTKKIRTLFINGKTISDLQNALELMLEQNSIEYRVNGESFRYTLGSIIYLIDIRFDTYFKSKRAHPNNEEQWFGPETLKELFKENEKIRYRYCQALGNPKKIREYYKDDPDKQKELYLQYIQSNHKNYNSKNDFERLYAIATQKKPIYQICLMCYCEPKKRFCHISIFFMKLYSVS